MKMKKLIPVLALLMGLSTFSGCTNNDQKVMFEPYWNERASSGAIPIDETLVYNVTFAAKQSSLVNYTLAYQNGTYTTHLVGEEVNGEFVYTYTTNLSIAGSFTFDSNVKEFTDSVTSEVKFKAATAGLQPIYSKKEIKSHSPGYGQATTLEECYAFYDYSISTTYLDGCTSGQTLVTKNPPKDDDNQVSVNFTINQEKFSFLDNEQLLAAIRCMRSTATSAKINMYSPFVNAVQKVAISFAADETKNYTFNLNGTEVKEDITVRVASIVLDEQNPGETQTAYFAKHTELNGTSNKYRNVMLYLETPLPYALGSLQYTLISMTNK